MEFHAAHGLYNPACPECWEVVFKSMMDARLQLVQHYATHVGELERATKQLEQQSLTGPEISGG